MFELHNQLLAIAVQELGYSKIRVLSFKLQEKAICQINSRIVVLRGKIRKKYKK